MFYNSFFRLYENSNIPHKPILERHDIIEWFSALNSISPYQPGDIDQVNDILIDLTASNTEEGSIMSN